MVVDSSGTPDAGHGGARAVPSAPPRGWSRVGATGHAGTSRQPEGRYRAGPGGPRMRAALRASSGSLGTPCGVPLSCLAAPAWRRLLFRADFWLAARIRGDASDRALSREGGQRLGAIAGALPLAIGPDLLDLGPSVEGPPSRRRPLPRRERDPRPVASNGEAMISPLDQAGISAALWLALMARRPLGPVQATGAGAPPPTSSAVVQQPALALRRTRADRLLVGLRAPARTVRHDEMAVLEHRRMR